MRSIVLLVSSLEVSSLVLSLMEILFQLLLKHLCHDKKYFEKY